MGEHEGERLEHLFAPGRIGTLEVRNRILLCPMGDNQANDDGTVSDHQLDYYEARARGGAGLLLVGSVGVAHPEGISGPNQLGAGNDGARTGAPGPRRARPPPRCRDRRAAQPHGSQRALGRGERPAAARTVAARPRPLRPALAHGHPRRARSDDRPVHAARGHLRHTRRHGRGPGAGRQPVRGRRGARRRGGLRRHRAARRPRLPARRLPLPGDQPP